MIFKLLLAVTICVSIANAAVEKSAFGQFRFKCSIATICTDLANCDQNGVISKTPVSLTPEEEEQRAPLVPCRQKSGGDGFCCRDPDFKDDWPANFVDPGLPRPSIKPADAIRPTPKPTPAPPPPPPPKKKPPKAKIINTGCPERNRTALPDLNPGAWVPGDFDSGFGEFLWQAAIFDSSKNFMCGCYLTDQYTCTTTASCVKSYISNPSKIQVGIGAYDLRAFDLQEPGGGSKYTQFSRALEIATDPSGRDIAVVSMNTKDDPVEYNYYTAPICIDLPEGLRVFNYDNCVITGWGSARSTPHWYDVKLLSEDECTSLVPGFKVNFQSCARADKDICDLVEFGNGLQCRYRGKRDDRDVRDVYWLRGVFNDIKCTPGNQIIVYTHLDMDWLDKLLKKRQEQLQLLESQ